LRPAVLRRPVLTIIIRVFHARCWTWRRYVGHAFKFVSPSTKALVARLVMRADTTMYIVEPSEDDVATLQSAEYLKVRQLRSTLQEGRHLVPLPPRIDCEGCRLRLPRHFACFSHFFVSMVACFLCMTIFSFFLFSLQGEARRRMVQIVLRNHRHPLAEPH